MAVQISGIKSGTSFSLITKPDGSIAPSVQRSITDIPQVKVIPQYGQGNLLDNVIGVTETFPNKNSEEPYTVVPTAQEFKDFVNSINIDDSSTLPLSSFKYCPINGNPISISDLLEYYITNFDDESLNNFKNNYDYYIDAKLNDNFTSIHEQLINKKDVQIGLARLISNDSSVSSQPIQIKLISSQRDFINFANIAHCEIFKGYPNGRTIFMI